VTHAPKQTSQCGERRTMRPSLTTLLGLIDKYGYARVSAYGQTLDAPASGLTQS